MGWLCAFAAAVSTASSEFLYTLSGSDDVVNSALAEAGAKIVVLVQAKRWLMLRGGFGPAVNDPP